MIMGYPGSTDRFLTSWGVKEAVGIEQPARVKIRKIKLDIMDEQMSKSQEERRKDLVKKAKSEGEHAKVSIRSQRKDANEMVRSLKDEGLSEDAVKDSEIQIQKLTDSFSDKVDEFVSLKEVDIMKV